MSKDGCTSFLKSFLEKSESNGYSFFCELRDMAVGSSFVSEIEHNMRISRSLILIHDDSFCMDEMNMFKIQVGKHLKHGNKNFKLIVLELVPIVAEDLCCFKLFSRITIKKHEEEKLYQFTWRILNETGIVFILLEKKIYIKDRTS